MDTADSAPNFEYIANNEQSVTERIDTNVGPLEANITRTTNNITTTVETDPLELSVDIEKKYGIPPCFVQLERCDNIWKTLQLIRDLQDVTSECSENESDTEKYDEYIEPTSSINDNESCSSSTQPNNTMAPYIKYQPVLNNGNSALNFQFSVKSTRLLYQCHECGKQYSHRSTLRDHSEKIHNIILPIIRKRPENTNNDSKNIQSKANNDFHESNDVSRDENSTISTDNHDNSSTNDFQDDGALLDSASDINLSNKEHITIAGDKIFICHYCNRQYKDKYYFNHHMKHSHGTSIAGIRSYIKRTNNNDIDEQRSSKKSRRVQQNDQSRSLNVHRCNTCGKHFYNKARLGCHRRKVHGIYVSKSKQRNRINNRLQTNKSVNNKTDVIHHAPITSEIDTSGEMEDNRKVNPCVFCEKVYVDRSCWKSHLEKVHDIKFAKFNRTSKKSRGLISCKECGRQYLYKRSLIEHQFTVHGQRLQHECDECGLWFQNSDSLIKHALDIHKIMLIQRILRRTKDKPHKCHVCFTHYGLKRNLVWHLIEAHGIKNLGELKTVEKSLGNSSYNKPTTRRRPSPSLSSLSSTSSSSSKALRKGLRDKTRINYNEAVEPRSIEQLLLGDGIRNKENVDATDKIDGGNVVSCCLCQRRCIKILRHFIEYHKIRHPEALIAQCKPVLSAGEIDDNNMENVIISKNRKTNRKNHNSNRVINKPRNTRNIDPSRLFISVITAAGRRVYKCKICPNYVREHYENLRKHEKQHRRQDKHLPIPDSEIKFIEQTNNSKKRKRVSVHSHDTRSRRLSDSGEHIRTTRASTKLKEEREFRCTVCERLFRNAEILSSHKISCKAYHGENSSINDASDTRESSDRDSGIGISITIKKKNNSYEIVGREGNEEEKFLNSNEKRGDEMKDDVLGSDSSSDAFTITTNHKNYESKKSFTYSKNHRIIKIQKVEDVDIDIDLESLTNSPANLQCENNQEVTSSGQDNTNEISDCRIAEAEPQQILSLKELCKNVLAKTKNNDKYLYKCRKCPKTWPSQAACNSHMRAHAKFI